MPQRKLISAGRYFSLQGSEPRVKNVLYGGFNSPLKREWQEGSNSQIRPQDLIFPVFVSDVKGEKTEIPNLPVNYRVGYDRIVEYLDPLVSNGLKAILMFGSVQDGKKDSIASYATSPENPVTMSIPEILKSFPHLTIICDVCICGYTSDGNCFLKKNGEFSHEHSVKRITDVATAYAKAGCHVVAPSDMIDNRVLSIKRSLINVNLHSKVSVMSYSSKFSSALYGPFRNACKTCFSREEIRVNQLPVGSSGLAMRAINRDIEEGVDFIIVKPGITSLDIIAQANIAHSEYPIFAYQVSGEYSMLYYGAKNGCFDLTSMVFETMVCFKRAGCTGIISYFTPHILETLASRN